MMTQGSALLLTGQKQTADTGAHSGQDGKLQKRLNRPCDTQFKAKVKFAVQWCNGNDISCPVLASSGSSAAGGVHGKNSAVLIHFAKPGQRRRGQSGCVHVLTQVNHSKSIRPAVLPTAIYYQACNHNFLK